MDKTKVLYLNSAFSVKDIKESLPSASDKIDSIYIEGYASTNDVDRAGDVVSTSVWEKGIQNYLKNPIILAHHDHDDPVGRMVDYRIDEKGLWIKARVSAAAEIFNLVKDKVLTAFSIGFRVVDAEYNAAAEIFMVKELELVEISIVSVPCNQNTIFSLAKAFNSAEDYQEFKKQFATPGNVAKGLKSISEASSNSPKEWNMNPEEIKQMLADAAKNAAEQATKSLLAAQAEEQAKALAKAQEEEALAAKVKAAVEATVKTVDTGAERLLEEVSKRLEAQSQEAKSVLAGLEATIKEKADELAKVQASKMQFSDSGKQGELSYADREKAVLLGKITGKGTAGTKFGNELIVKYGPHLPSATWELEVSLNMEAEVRRRLVVVPTIRAINMQTNVMTIPVNPEAGLATWVTNANFGAAPATLGAAGASAGTTGNHQVKEITLNAYKLATNEYMNYEEEEDSLIVLMPIVRDAMVRRVARSLDRAYLYGAGTTNDPVKGLATWAASATTLPTTVTGAASGVVTVAALRALRKDLGAWGLDPAEIVYVVSTDVYYQLLEDTSFQTMNQVGTQATLLTGQIGSIGNTPVLVSGEFATKATGTVGAVCYAPGNFLAGNQRGLRFDTQELVETQRRVLVASLRSGMTQVTTNLGNGVAKLVHTA